MKVYKRLFSLYDRAGEFFGRFGKKTEITLDGRMV